MRKTQPYMPKGIEQQGRWPGPMHCPRCNLVATVGNCDCFPARFTSELIEETPVKRHRESLGCWLVYPILRLAAKVMDEPEGAGKPPMPWRELSLCALIAMVSVLAVWTVLGIAP